jgi:hypothetical protein
MISPATFSKVRSKVPPDIASKSDEYTMALTFRDSVYIQAWSTGSRRLRPSAGKLSKSEYSRTLLPL